MDSFNRVRAILSLFGCLVFLFGSTLSSQECNHAEQADIVVAVDGSTSVGNNSFDKAKEFVQRLVDAFLIGPSATQIAVVVFSDTIVTQLNFNMFSTSNQLKHAIDSTQFPGGATDIASVIQDVEAIFQIKSTGRRPNAIGIAIFMTDGGSSDIEPSIAAAQTLKELGVIIYTAGVGISVKENELKNVASQQEYYFKASDYNSLDSISGPLLSAACSDLNGCICYNKGTCAPGNLGSKCVCPTIYTGFYCEKPICNTFPCVHGACNLSGDSWYCICQPGYTGKLCSSEIDECESNPCQHDGTCSDSINSFSCLCIPGFTGITCEIDIDECESSPCENGGTCRDWVNAFSCDCPPRYYGIYCEAEIDECESNPCQHDGTCSDSINSFSCLCMPGFTGITCEIDIDECESSLCENGGTCRDWVNAFSCDCPPRYYGIYCEAEIDECESNPCQHDGTCSDSINSFSCLCIPGFTGITCEIGIDECESSPCENGGTCRDWVNAFSCDCPPRYYGIYCEAEIDECESNPCQHDGTCSDSINSFSCLCIPGFTGITCEIDIDECESSPCENGGTCRDWVNAFSCDCPPRYYGIYCEAGICQPSVADIVFVLDSSSSQRKDEFEKQLDFINHFIDHIVIGEYNFQVGVVTYSYKAVTEISLGEFNDNTTLKEAVSKIEYKPGATFTNKGLIEAEKVFENTPSQRPYGHTAKRFAFVLTDGLSTDRASTAKAAKSLRSTVNKVLALGIGNEVSHLELLSIASTENTDTGRKYVYSMQNCNALYTVVKDLVKLTCEECYWKTSSDVLFLLDMSTTVSVGNFQIGLNAITYLVQKTTQMETVNNKVRIGLVTYGIGIQLHRTMDDSETKETFLSSVQKIVLHQGHCPAEESQCERTKLDDALRVASRDVFNKTTKTTKEKRKIVVILTNGQRPVSNEIISELKKLRKGGKDVYVIALGQNADMQNLQKIVGDPALVFSVYDESSTKSLEVLATEFFFSSCNLTNDFLND